VGLADTAPIREALQANDALVGRLEGELQGVRRTFSMGVKGLGAGVAYFLYQIGFGDRALSAELTWEAVAVGIVCAIALEVANFLFLSKRRRIRQLSAEIDEAREERRRLEKLLREASRV
jgi:hypothetical protein